MTEEIIWGLFIPFLGTLFGSLGVLLFKFKSPEGLVPVLGGSAAGVMTAAGIWSLILPAIDYSANMGAFSFLPAAIGFLLGAVFMVPLEKQIRRLEIKITSGSEGKGKGLLSFFAVTLHNFPEGLAVGMAFAATREEPELLLSAIALSTGIALQNIPEGAIVALPVVSQGRGRALFRGIASGLAEPVAAAFALLLSDAVREILPYFMGFAAGAMMFVVMGELSEEMRERDSFPRGITAFAIGFCIMMSLDVALG